MKRSPGITAAAVVAFLGSLFSTLVGILILLGGLATTSAPMSRPDLPVPPIPPAVIAAIAAIGYVGFGLWGIASAAGVLQLRNWARRCFLVFGGLLAFLSACVAAGSVLSALAISGGAPITADVPREALTGIFLLIALFSLACLAIAIWWLVYFNRPAVKAAFAGDAAATPQPPRIPLAVSVNAWLLVAGGIGLGFQMLLSPPLPILGFILRGWPAGLVLAVMAAVCLTSGLGMLKKRVDAHALAVGYLGFSVLNLAANVAMPGAAARMLQIVQEAQVRSGLPATAPTSMMTLGTTVGTVVSLLSTIVMLFFLIRARKPFIDACRS